MTEKFEDTKGVFSIHISKNDKKANNDLQNNYIYK